MQIFPCQVAPFGVMPKDNHMVWCFAKIPYIIDLIQFIMFTRSIGDNEGGVVVNVGLCAGRHDIEGITDYIFTEPIENPNDFQTLRLIANEKLEQMWNDGNCINIFVTGLSQAMTIVASEVFGLYELTEYDILVQVYHWDRETETYKAHTLVGS